MENKNSSDLQDQSISQKIQKQKQLQKVLQSDDYTKDQSKYSTPSKQSVKTKKVYKIGKAQFCQEVRLRTNLRYFHAKIMQFLQNETWNFPFLSDKDIDIWDFRLKLMTKAEITIFDYGKWNNPKILKSIEHIQFPNLKLLNLFCTKIESIEPLPYMNFANLEEINLIYSNCYNFNTMAKMNIKPLKKIHLYVMGNNGIIMGLQQNNIYIESISRWNMNLSELRLQKWGYDNVIIPDLNTFSKIKQIKTVYISIKQRIKQLKQVKALKNRQNINFKCMNQQNFYAYQDLYVMYGV